jgi:hypothetical protein
MANEEEEECGERLNKTSWREGREGECAWCFWITTSFFTLLFLEEFS